MATMWFSMSIELIHSPPDLITSLERSVMMTAPSSSYFATSPVTKKPLWNLSGASNWKYSEIIQGPFTRSSPLSPRGMSLSRLSGSAILKVRPGMLKPALVQFLSLASEDNAMSLNFAVCLAIKANGFVSVIPHPWTICTPNLSAYHFIIALAGAEPPQVRVLSASCAFTLSMPLFSMMPCTPCQTVGTPLLNVTFQSMKQSNRESGSMYFPLKIMRVPSMVVTKGTPQARTWNIGTTGRTTSAPERPRLSAPPDARVWR
mmetsp:Transcript_39868/g.85371  ORF Transcript_39868/g.85371 Transcript_39868/m.85371 type:complete len:260 (-) Transcript_39868:707-1486(-)